MHKSGHFSIKEITKVEGHANLNVELDNGKVKKCELEIYEGQRFFESLVLGRSYSQIPLMVSRICGLCNVSHLNTAMEAVEKAFNVEVSEQAALLREIATNGEFIKSHALHLFFLVLPDYLGRESVLDFNEEEHKYVHWGLDLKKAGTEIVKLLGGRIYQTVGIRPGGFTLIPKQAQLDRCLKILEGHRQIALDAVALFASFENQLPFERKTDYLGLVRGDYSLTEGTLKFLSGKAVREEDMLKHVHEFIAPYSNAKQTDFEGNPFRVGALARVNLNQKSLEPDARKAIKDLKLSFPNNKIYHNNTCQALELLHLFDRTINLIKDLKVRKEAMQEIRPKQATGIGVTEAPRGTLYHEYDFDSKGFVKKANIIVPTNQNNHTVELDLTEFIPSLLELPQEKANLEIEKVIRAYDPCISCATHFLKVNWKQSP
jgi:coenzyme F420-reducing hydrogenase alpha subunit